MGDHSKAIQMLWLFTSNGILILCLGLSYYVCFNICSLTFLPGFVFQRQRSKNLALNATSTSHINNRISLFLLFFSDTRSAPTRRPFAANETIKCNQTLMTFNGNQYNHRNCRLALSQSLPQCTVEMHYSPLENVSLRASNFKFDEFPPLFFVPSTRLMIERVSDKPSSPK